MHSWTVKMLSGASGNNYFHKGKCIVKGVVGTCLSDWTCPDTTWFTNHSGLLSSKGPVLGCCFRTTIQAGAHTRKMDIKFLDPSRQPNLWSVLSWFTWWQQQAKETVWDHVTLCQDLDTPGPTDAHVQFQTHGYELRWTHKRARTLCAVSTHLSFWWFA
jgi:hypothetical protein